MGQKTAPLEDPVFGRIEFARGVWTSMRTAKPPMLVIVAPESGPVESQRSFYRRIYASFDKLAADARRFVRASAPEVDVSRLSPYAIDIGPESEVALGSFVIEFADEHQNEIHRVEFINGKPATYGCDD